jgi:hypothetical protein
VVKDRGHDSSFVGVRRDGRPVTAQQQVCQIRSTKNLSSSRPSTHWVRARREVFRVRAKYFPQFSIVTRVRPVTVIQIEWHAICLAT